MPEFTAIREEHSFVDLQGVTITYYSWSPGRPTGVVVIAHGLGDHALRFEHVAQRFVKAGWRAVAIEQRGHGATGLAQHGGDVSKLGTLGPGGIRAVERDLEHLVELERGERPTLPLAVVGHSWGSITVQSVLNRRPELFDAVVLSGTALRVPGAMTAGPLNARHKHLGDTGHEWLSRDPEVAARFRDDPLTFSADVIKQFGLGEGLKLFGVPARSLRRDVPLLIEIGSDDSLGGPKSVARLGSMYEKRSGLTDVTVRVYPGARHEIFNEINKSKVLDDTVEWLAARFDPANDAERATVG